MTEHLMRQPIEDLAVTEKAGLISLAPGSCTFIVI